MNYLTTNDIPSIFEDVFFKDFFNGNDFFSPLPLLKKIDYPVDIYETNEGLNLNIAAIGLDKQDIKIDVKDDVLSISHNKREKEPITKASLTEKRYAYQGITQKSFNMAWRINDKFDLTKINASLDKGLLKITIPIAPEKQSNQIEVKIQ
ncbi:MAG: Hsp20/alpha crystallin family protein [Candidatus Nanoarchaeia archaeon]|jgi:HSP20 family protein|nr:Hsp20/alpha crystallin family protein [Candidatus Nanoarchaeia archaeon]